MNAKITHYYVATLLGQYEVEGQVKQRYLNIIFDIEEPKITRAILQNVNTSAIQLLITTSHISPAQVLDMTPMNINPLGAMTAEEFHGPDGDTDGEDDAAEDRPVPSPLN